MKKQLWQWQETCLAHWMENGCRGIVHVVTGAGKTVLALAAVARLMAEGRPLSVRVVVPKTFLLHQWHRALIEELDIPRADIGFCSGAHKAESRPFMLYVVNSARDRLPRDVVECVAAGRRVLLVADECHHYGSAGNARMFAYANYLSEDAALYTLGLSATPWCKHFDDVLVPALGAEIHRFGFVGALRAGIISDFTLFNIRVEFTQEEAEAYDVLSEQLTAALGRMYKLFPDLYKKREHHFFAALEYIISHGEPEESDLAKAVMHLSVMRKEGVYRARHRMDCLMDLTALLPREAKIIIFGERIDTAEEAFAALWRRWPNQVGIFHSKVPKDIARNTLRRFNTGDIRLLVSCKTLDEGLNVADADVGIVLSSTAVRRQRVQRLGRILRKKASGEKARFYYLYVGDTSEEASLLNEMDNDALDRLINRIDLQYNAQEHTFQNAAYARWCAAAARKLEEKGFPPEALAEFRRCAHAGLVSDDWLRGEASCQARIAAANSKASHNYAITMELIRRARAAGTRPNQNETFPP